MKEAREWPGRDHASFGGSPMSLKQRLPLEFSRHHEDSEARRTTVRSRVLHLLRGRRMETMWNRLTGRLFPDQVNSEGSTHHVVRLQVPLQLIPQGTGTEFHDCNRSGAARQDTTNLRTGTLLLVLTTAASARTSLSALTKASERTSALTRVGFSQSEGFER